ncbi:IS3 family transposase [Achromobacter xylosoxidans]|uniref:IS3 family transposase n=1 Tax=Alcaligenes xylosoxydans xylosoxydans TaxID=85698 RepID=UPI00375EE5F1
MKRSRFTEEQITYALRLADSGTPVVDVCRQLGVSEATFYTWKKKYADFGVSELRKLKQLEDENARLRRIVADLTLDKQILQEVGAKKSLKAAKRRELAAWIHERFQISVQRACALALLQRSTWYAKSHARDQSALRQRIRDIALSRPRFGYRRVLVMLQREGWNVGKKRVYRLYSLEGLQLRMKVKRRKRIALLRGKPPVPTGPNQHWSMDFVHDQMLDGRSVRILTVIDQWSRESVCLEANFRQTGRGVGQALDRSAVLRGWPKAITVDNGTEFTSRALDDWAYRRGIKLDYTRPGKPTDNGLIESFNGRLRDEFLNVHEFITLHDLQQKLRAWQDDYNHHRPHGSLGHLTPREYVQKWSVQPKEADIPQF